MATKIFNNLCVADLDLSKAFFTALGFRVEPKFSNEAAACIVVSDHIHVMLLTPGFMGGFTPKKLVNAHESTEVIMALSFDGRTEVDAAATAALAHGGTELNEAKDHGFMYIRTLNDPDGHIWEFFWMDPDANPNG